MVVAVCKWIAKERNLDSYDQLLKLPLGTLLAALLEVICARHEMGIFSAMAFDDLKTPEDWITQTGISMTATGLFWTLGHAPSTIVPVSLILDDLGRQLRYQLRIGRSDQAWAAMTENKRWNEIYLLVHDEPRLNWSREFWDFEVTGTL